MFWVSEYLGNLWYMYIFNCFIFFYFLKTSADILAHMWGSGWGLQKSLIIKILAI